MQKKIFILFISTFLFISNIISQPSMTNVWYFGTHAGLKFVGGNPVALSNGQINNGEGCSVECDNYGDLLFYTDGVTVWNKNHVTMPNGTGLNGNTSATQTVIIRKPGNCMQYYIFYHSGQVNLQLYYCIVDMTLNGGLGDVVASSKNTFIYYPATEKITAVTHQNGVDIWVLFHEYNTNKFMAYLVTSTGLNSPVNTNVGPAHNNMIGYMKASHNGSKLATAITFTPDIRVELYDFNNATGVVSNPVLFNNWSGAYGLEFSPNDSILYASTYWGTNKLYQINLTNNTFQTISSANNGNYDYCALQLGPNGKIYMARGNQNYISVINNPNVLGAGCGFVSNGFTLAPGTFSVLGLPTFHQSLLNFHSNYFTYSHNACTTYDFHTTPSGAYDSLTWNFNDPLSGSSNFSNVLAPSHSFTNAGNYNVTLIIYNKCYIDTLHQLINVTANNINIDIGYDTTICTNSSVTFNAGSGYANYIWSTGATTSSISTSNPGIYAVTVSNSSGCTGIDSVHLFVSSSLNINLGNDTAICSGSQITYNAGSAYSSYLWNTGSSSPSITVSSNGTYAVTVTNSTGCIGIDSVHLLIFPGINLNIGNDTSLCSGNQILLSAGNSFSSYNWSTGATTSSISASTAAIYTVTVTNSNGCSATDAIILSLNPSPSINLGNDTIICNGSQITINAGIGSYSYLWNTGQSSSSISVSAAGNYSVTATNSAGCQASDAIQVTVNPNPTINLGNDTSLCSGQNIILSSGAVFPNYLWQNGSTNSSFTVNNSGVYWLQVTDQYGCKDRDTINISFNSSPSVNLGNDTTLCPGNSVMLNAGNPGASYNWSTGSTNQIITVHNSGIYWVSVSNGNCSSTDSIDVVFQPIQVNLGNDTLICGGGAFILDAGNAGNSYNWSTGATSQLLSVNSTGTYIVTVSNSFCSGTDEVTITFATPPVVNIGNDTALCQGTSVNLDAGNAGSLYSWSNGQTSQTVTVTNSGEYIVTVNNGTCITIDSVNINFQTFNLDIGNDTVLCGLNSFLLDAGNPGGTYLWSTADTTQTITVTTSGDYWVSVNNSVCSGTDSIAVSFNSAPIIALSPDTIICVGSSITLDAGNVGATYLWSTSSISQVITIDTPGFYWVSVTLNNCSSIDPITVRPPPALDLGRDVSLCNKAEITLSTDIVANSYLWSTGNANPSITVTEPGEYWVIAQVENCTLTDSIKVSGGEISLYIPNAFTPNNDGVNEIFAPIGEGISNYHLMVFTRWGEMIFESNNINEGWDGKFKGNLCQDDIYAWVLEYGTICTGDRNLRKYGLVMLMK